MRMIVRADDGDQITVDSDDLATEQRIIRLELHNLTFGDVEEFESISMTVERARELASALLTVADAIDDFETNDKPSLGHSALGDVRASQFM